MITTELHTGKSYLIRIVNPGREYSYLAIVKALAKAGLVKTPSGQYSGTITIGVGSTTAWLGILADKGILSISERTGGVE